MTLRIGFLGCGGFARRYHVPALADSAAGRISIICDSAPNDALRAIAARAGAPIVATVEELLTPGSCEAVIVSTPHMLHAAHAALVLQAGRHCMVDKPFVMRMSEAQALDAEATRRGLVNAVAFNRRLDRGCLRARELIRGGAIGAMRYVQTVQLGYERGGWFLDPALGGGGPFTGRATHMADLVPWLLDRKPTALRARLRGGSATRADDGGFIELQFDALECQITCVSEGWHMWDEVRVFGEDGMIELRRPLHIPIGWELAVQSERGAVRESTAADATPGAATRDFLAAIAGGQRVACSFADACVSVRIIEEAFASARSDGGWRRL
jgi:predicted dehydrogenase